MKTTQTKSNRLHLVRPSLNIRKEAAEGDLPVAALLSFEGGPVTSTGLSPLRFDVEATNDSSAISSPSNNVRLFFPNDVNAEFLCWAYCKFRVPINKFPVDSTIPTPSGTNFFFPGSELNFSLAFTGGSAGTFSQALIGNDMIKRNGVAGSFYDFMEVEITNHFHAAMGGAATESISGTFGIVSNAGGVPGDVMSNFDVATVEGRMTMFRIA